MRGVPEAIAKIVHDAHLSAGVTMIIGTGISHLTENAIHLIDGREIKADTTIAGIGASPEVKLATDAGLHDLRHSFASIAVSGGASLPIIGALLGHAHSATTQRYAQLSDDPLRAASDAVGSQIAASLTFVAAA